MKTCTMVYTLLLWLARIFFLQFQTHSVEPRLNFSEKNIILTTKLVWLWHHSDMKNFLPGFIGPYGAKHTISSTPSIALQSPGINIYVSYCKQIIYVFFGFFVWFWEQIFFILVIFFNHIDYFFQDNKIQTIHQ